MLFLVVHAFKIPSRGNLVFRVISGTDRNSVSKKKSIY